MKQEHEKIGRIAAVRKNSFIILWENRELHAKVRGSFYEKAADQWPVVGDYVSFAHNPAGDSVIQSVVERKNLLQRPDQAKTGVMQYMVSNVDYCFIVTALNEDYSFNRIARYVSVALQGGAVPVVILTKADLCFDVEKFVREVQTVSDRVRVHAVSALRGTGMEALAQYLTPGVTVCLMGSSGAGKSTLINTLAGEEIMQTSTVRASDSTGRHTTTHRQLIQMSNGVSVIDTPGMREIGMARAEEGIDHTFSDILELESRCKFRNCRHASEPSCAVKEALADGTLSAKRWNLYLSLTAENSDYAEKKKAISKLAKAYKSEKKG